MYLLRENSLYANTLSNIEIFRFIQEKNILSLFPFLLPSLGSFFFGSSFSFSQLHFINYIRSIFS